MSDDSKGQVAKLEDWWVVIVIVIAIVVVVVIEVRYYVLQND